jgi:hypothetical protein
MNTKTCNCQSYSFPHRLGSGNCEEKCPICKKVGLIKEYNITDKLPYGEREVDYITHNRYCKGCKSWI